MCPVLSFPVVTTITMGKGVRISPPHPSGVASAMGQEMPPVKDLQRGVMSGGMVLDIVVLVRLWGRGKWYEKPFPWGIGRL